MTELWVLGSEQSGATKYIDWVLPFPNFANADILIINLQTLPEIQPNSDLYNAIFYEVRRYLFDMLMTREKQIIVIMSPKVAQMSCLPIFPICRKIAAASLNEFSEDQIISDYLKNVESCSFYFLRMNFEYFMLLTNPKSNAQETFTFTEGARHHYEVKLCQSYNILNSAKQTVGGSYYAEIKYAGESTETETSETWYINKRFLSGLITYLPPPTRGSLDVSINNLIAALKGEQANELAPKWDEEVFVQGVPQLEEELKTKRRELTALNENIGNICQKIAEKTKLRRLLWAEGKSLEAAVKDAFTILGFTEIRKIRPDNLEDWIIDFKHVGKYTHAVLEVKASEKRTSLADLTQCNKWVEDYMLEDKEVKGVFAPNQFRIEDIKTSSKKRAEFSPNEVDYARTREICILPTHYLFELVRQKNEEGNKLTRKSIEEKIAATNGLYPL